MRFCSFSATRRLIVWVTFTVAALLCLQTTSAQNSTGSLRGEVQDASGARVPNAQVTVSGLGSNFTRETIASGKGEFRIDDLFPGTYKVTVKAPTFADAQSTVQVLVSTVGDLLVTMKPAAVSAQVSVQSEASSVTTEPIDTASAVHQGTVTNRDLQTLPLAARSFANIAYLIPGTEPVGPSDPTNARITAVSTGGSSGLNNVLSVDGGDNSDDWIGGFLQNFSPDAIQEFAVRTGRPT